jgi:hypothetical protein
VKRLTDEERKKRVLARGAAYRAANREKLREVGRLWRAAHPEKSRASSKANYAAKRDENVAKKKAYNAARREEINAKSREYRQKNLDKVLDRNKRYRTANRAALREKGKIYAKSNPDKTAASVRRRQAAQIMACPAWADHKKIREIYKAAVRLTSLTGIKHVVDHLYPLRGRTVCGLHVHENLRAITESENLLKANKFPKFST